MVSTKPANKNVQIEQVHTLYRQSPLLLTVISLLTCIVMTYYWDKVEHQDLLIWLSLVILIAVIRVMLLKIYKEKQTISMPKYWLHAFSFSIFLSGLVWGVGLPLVLSPVLDSDILVISFILVGLVAGSLVPLSIYLPCYILFIIPTAVPYSFYLLSIRDGELFVSAALVFIFLLAMLGFSLVTNRNSINAIKLRFTNQELLESLKEEKESAEQANTNKSRFLAATSHDVRQPLYALDLYLASLQHLITQDEQHELLNKAMISSRALSGLFNKLIDISMLESGTTQVNAQRFSLTTLLALIADECEAKAKEHNIEISMELDNVIVYSDPVLVSRIFRNLLMNAIKHNQDCAVKVSTTLSNGKCTISIQDSGIGIDSAELKNIFSEYYQLNNPERDQAKGLGLGLDIVQRLAHLLDMQLTVESRLGQGSTFSLTTTVETDELRRETLAVPIIDSNLAGVFVILIDDNVMVREATKTLLRSWQCEVLASESVDELLILLEKEHYPEPDLIMSDYRLRDNKTGTDAILAVRHYFNKPISGIIVTGDSSTEIIDDAKKQACKLLLKPVQKDLLRSEIEKLVSDAIQT